MDNMGNKTITAANAVFTLTVPGIYDSPVKIEAFSTDAMLSAEQTNPGVAEMGVDGHLSFGWVPVPTVVTITLAADSPSLEIFENWDAYQKAAQEVYACSAQFTVPGLGKTYTGTRGVLTAMQPVPNAAKTMQAPAYAVTFEKWIPANL